MEEFGITLYLDTVRHEDLDEFNSCGFLGVKGQFRSRRRQRRSTDCS